MCNGIYLDGVYVCVRERIWAHLSDDGGVCEYMYNWEVSIVGVWESMWMRYVCMCGVWIFWMMVIKRGKSGLCVCVKENTGVSEYSEGVTAWKYLVGGMCRCIWMSCKCLGLPEMGSVNGCIWMLCV